MNFISSIVGDRLSNVNSCVDEPPKPVSDLDEVTLIKHVEQVKSSSGVIVKFLLLPVCVGAKLAGAASIVTEEIDTFWL